MQLTLFGVEIWLSALLVLGVGVIVGWVIWWIESTAKKHEGQEDFGDSSMVHQSSPEPSSSNSITEPQPESQTVVGSTTGMVKSRDDELLRPLPQLIYVLAILCGGFLLVITISSQGTAESKGAMIGWTIGSTLGMICTGRVIELLQKISDGVRVLSEKS